MPRGGTSQVGFKKQIQFFQSPAGGDPAGISDYRASRPERSGSSGPQRSPTRKPAQRMAAGDWEGLKEAGRPSLRHRGHLLALFELHNACIMFYHELVCCDTLRSLRRSLDSQKQTLLILDSGSQWTPLASDLT